jgi:hypothetical protein
MHNKRVKLGCNNRPDIRGNVPSMPGTPGGKAQHPLRRSARGQAIVIIALAMFVLIGLVGLAVDGGSMYLQRRTAQNSTDGAALAGTKTMLIAYEGMLYDNNGTVGPGDRDIEDSLLEIITEYASVNGIVADTVAAYFVNDDKQIVSASQGEDDGNGNPVCGTTGGLSPCKVGQNGYVPWNKGVKGITVSARAETSAFFMSLFGYKTIAADASATAFMGPTSMTGQDVTILPIGFYTTTEHLLQMKPYPKLYTLISGNLRKIPTPLDPDLEWEVSGNWGYVAFNESGTSTNVVNAWIRCGFNPRALKEADWSAFCTDKTYTKVTDARGPTDYWLGTATEPDLTKPYSAPRLEWRGVDGKGPHWWLQGSSGVSSSCSYFKKMVEDLDYQPVYYIPIFDRWTGGGENTYFHLLTLAQFRFDSQHIDCHSPRQNWAIEGYFEYSYMAGASGHHGDLVHSSPHTVFLEP